MSENVSATDNLLDDGPVPEATKEPQKGRTSRTRLYVRRFLRNKPAVGGVIIFLFLVLCALFGGLLTPWTYTDMDFLALTSPPSETHWFGTNAAGNDIYAQIMHGLQRSIVIGVTVSVGSTLIAAFVGATAAFLGGRAEKAILAVIHFMLIIPSFLILALIANSAGGDWRILIIVMIAFNWVFSSRIIWSLSMSIREREYVYAARYMGVPGAQIVSRHMIPNIGSLLVLQFTLGVVSAIMAETGLSFLGFGVKIPDVSLGTLLQDGANSLVSAPWSFYFVAATLTLLTVSMALISDGLRDALDPNSAAGGRA